MVCTSAPPVEVSGTALRLSPGGESFFLSGLVYSDPAMLAHFDGDAFEVRRSSSSILQWVVARPVPCLSASLACHSPRSRVIAD